MGTAISLLLVVCALTPLATALIGLTLVTISELDIDCPWDKSFKEKEIQRSLKKERRLISAGHYIRAEEMRKHRERLYKQ